MNRSIPFLIAAALLTLQGCAALKTQIQTPQLSLSQVQMLESTLLEQRYRLTVRVQNPNAVSLPIKGMNYAVKFAGVDFASGVTPMAFRVPARGEHNVDIDVTTNLLRSAQQLMTYLRDRPDTLDYELTGEIQVDLPFVGAVPFSRTGSVDLTTR